MARKSGMLRVAAMADLHCTKSSKGAFQALFAQVAESADVLALCGDLCDYGLPEEAHVLVGELTSLRSLPVVAVLGNHDFESDKQDEIQRILCEAGLNVLDGEAFEIEGISFAGIKGFGGGFGRGTLAPWGERTIKDFVREAVDETLKLESALARLRTPKRFALLHYSPIQATVEGEPPEIFPFLGTSRLEDPLLRFPVTCVFHGHAHRGAAEGRTTNGIPVYNVSMNVLRLAFPDQPQFRVIEVPIADPVA